MAFNLTAYCAVVRASVLRTGWKARVWVWETAGMQELRHIALVFLLPRGVTTSRRSRVIASRQRATSACRETISAAVCLVQGTSSAPLRVATRALSLILYRKSKTWPPPSHIN